MLVDPVVSLAGSVEPDEVIDLYAANHWSSANRPAELMAALRNSHSLATARIDGRLVGLANAISDGYLVVYFPHMLVHPDVQRRGIGRLLMGALLERYRSFHQLMLAADGDAVPFHEAMGFARAGRTVPMWIYAGTLPLCGVRVISLISSLIRLTMFPSVFCQCR